MAKEEKTLYQEFLVLREMKSEEKSVEPLYRSHLLKHLHNSQLGFSNVDAAFTDTISGSKTDGYLHGDVITDEKDKKPFYFLLEAKKGDKFSTPEGRVLGICQVIHYLHNMDEKGVEVPTVAMIGDLYHCLCFPTQYFISNYIHEKKYRWDIAPSAAFDGKDEILKSDLLNDATAKLIYGKAENIEQGFSIRNTIVPLIRGYAIDSNYRNPITTRNFIKIFNVFSDEVIVDDKKQNLTPRQKVAIFMSLLNGKVRTYDNNREIDCQSVDGVNSVVLVDPIAWASFKYNYDWNIKGSVLSSIIALSDDLIETEDRRRKGDYYTPDFWSNKALDLLSENILDEQGNKIDFFNDFIVWDCCSGPKTMTRNDEFEHLYCSTLFGNELKIAGDTGSTDFEYDFLNSDDVEIFERLLNKKKNGINLSIDDFDGERAYMASNANARKLLVELLERKRPLLFFVNPPYATPKNGGSDTVSKAGVSETKIKDEMGRLYGLADDAEQLYIQFMYRMIRIAELFDIPIYIGMFSTAGFLTGPSSIRFRKYLFDRMEYKDSFLINGSEFKGVTSSFSILFSVWKSGKQEESKRNEFKTTVYRRKGSEIAGEEKYLYNVDGLGLLNDWYKEKGKTFDSVQMINALEWYHSKEYVNKKGQIKKYTGSLLPNSLGYLYANANSVEQSNKIVYFLSSCGAGAHGTSITPNNFLKCTSGFMARRIGGDIYDWVNCKDEFLVPNIEHPEYQQWVNDSIVYSLFHTKSQQSSLRDVEYNGVKPIKQIRCVEYNETQDTYRIKNEFFFMSREEIFNLADEYFPDMYQKMKPKMRKGKDRFVYTLLNGTNEELRIDNFKLSEDAQEILDLARDIIKHTFKYREPFTNKSGDGQKYQVDNWDAGWYQIFGVYDKNDKNVRKGLVGWVLENYTEESDIKNNPNCLKSKVDRFLTLYKEFEDRRRPLLKELGYLK